MDVIRVGIDAGHVERSEQLFDGGPGRVGAASLEPFEGRAGAKADEADRPELGLAADFGFGFGVVGADLGGVRPEPIHGELRCVLPPGSSLYVETPVEEGRRSGRDLKKLEVADRIGCLADDRRAVVEQPAVCRTERDARALLDVAEGHEEPARHREPAGLLDLGEAALEDIADVRLQLRGLLFLLSGDLGRPRVGHLRRRHRGDRRTHEERQPRTNGSH
jgi:hypothetical protein